MVSMAYMSGKNRRVYQSCSPGRPQPAHPHCLLTMPRKSAPSSSAVALWLSLRLFLSDRHSLWSVLGNWVCCQILGQYLCQCGWNLVAQQIFNATVEKEGRAKSPSSWKVIRQHRFVIALQKNHSRKFMPQAYQKIDQFPRLQAAINIVAEKYYIVLYAQSLIATCDISRID